MAFKQRHPPLSSPHPPPMWAFKKWDEGALWGAGGKESFYCSLHSCPSKGGLVWGNPRAEIQDLYSSVDTVSGACTIGSTVGPRRALCFFVELPFTGQMMSWCSRLADSWLQTADLHSEPRQTVSPQGRQSSPPPLPTSSITLVLHSLLLSSTLPLFSLLTLTATHQRPPPFFSLKSCYLGWQFLWGEWSNTSNVPWLFLALSWAFS